MKLKKLLAGAVACTTIVSSLAVSASAFIDETNKDSYDPGLSTGSQQWLVQVYNVGNEAENKPAVDYGVDLSKITGARFVFSVTDDGISRESWDGGIGGAIVLSINGGDIAKGTDLYNKYNWPGSQEYWGVLDPDLGIETLAPEKALQAKTLGDYRYSLEMNNGLPNPFVEDGVTEVGCFQIALAEWGSVMCGITVESCEVLDTDGNVLVAFDGLGNQVDPADLPVYEEVSTDTSKEESTEESAAEESSEEESSVEESSAEESSAPETSAPATEAASSTTSAAANSGDNTGLIVGIVIAAVVVVVVIVAVVVVMKKKKA